LPEERCSTAAPVISVKVAGLAAVEFLNSSSRPLTRTSSPTATVGTAPVKTNSASDVSARSSSSPSGV
jgi:hypothetical protein